MAGMDNGTAPLVLTMGEPAGIGGEIALMAWQRRHEGIPVFAMLDDPERLRALARRLGWNVPVVALDEPAAAPGVWDHALPVLPIPLGKPSVPGQLDPANAGAVIQAIERAVQLVQSGKASAIVTNPINKLALYGEGFAYPGHTEFLAALAGPGITSIMMLACPDLRVVPVTVHLALRQALEALTSARIVEAGIITAAALARDFGIERPRLAVAGLNPHAGEGGSMGREEIEIIQPAIDALRVQGIEASGPAPADTLFHAGARSQYDAVLCMYHDQALIPLKTVDFHGGVNVTLGLPFIRTSPDHGTALGLAGTGTANPESLIAALRLAADMARHHRPTA
ncbi:MAG TPA: 4-hydroxythreonine-4-phosphate dehydrogenase PdxA [Stellaceae bacterium]|nr:4-hydroxythreonine-4-phosphate dehydrogenase PdxA [Stellaceae bacterium]